MRRTAPIVSRLLITASLALPGAASAQWAVFDSSNFGRNAITASQTASMYSQQLTDSAIRTQQLMTMLLNLKQVSPAMIEAAVGRKVLNDVVMQAGGDPNNGDWWGGLSKDELLKASGQTLDVYRSTARFMNQSNALYDKVANWTWDMQRFSAASGMSWQQIFEYENQRAQAGRALANAKYDEALNIQRDLSSYKLRSDQALQAAANSEGALQALGAVATQNQVLSDQLSRVIQLSSEQAKTDAARMAREEEESEKNAALQAEAKRAAQRSGVKR